jgi:Domain of unknown function (DUF4258)
MMDVKYRSHAVERMLERKITTVEVEMILLEPDGVIKQSLDKYIYYKQLKGRADNMIAAVTITKKHKSFEILTVMIDFEVV